MTNAARQVCDLVTRVPEQRMPGNPAVVVATAFHPDSHADRAATGGDWD